MRKLTRKDIWSLEEYANIREKFRKEMMQHKKARRIPIGPNATLIFEDVSTVKYQIQEMLRAERIFETKEINEELEAYNPLIPDGKNFKATFFIEYADAEVRRDKLAKLGGVEHKVWIRIGHGNKIYGIANEDMERSDGTKAAAVHFLRFELNPDNIEKAKDGQDIEIGIDHLLLTGSVTLNDQSRKSLASDLK